MNAVLRNAISIGSVALMAGCATTPEPSLRGADFISISALGTSEAVNRFTASLIGKNIAPCQKITPRGDVSVPAAQDNVSVEQQAIFRCDRSVPPETFGVFGLAYEAGLKEGPLRLMINPVRTFQADACPTGCVSSKCFGSTYRCYKKDPFLCFSGLC